MTNVINMFPPKPEKEKKEYSVALEMHMSTFLEVIDRSVLSFNELSVMDKVSLYATLVSFVHTLSDKYLELKESHEELIEAVKLSRGNDFE